MCSVYDTLWETGCLESQVGAFTWSYGRDYTHKHRHCQRIFFCPSSLLPDRPLGGRHLHGSRPWYSGTHTQTGFLTILKLYLVIAFSLAFFLGSLDHNNSKCQRNRDEWGKCGQIQKMFFPSILFCNHVISFLWALVMCRDSGDLQWEMCPTVSWHASFYTCAHAYDTHSVWFSILPSFCHWHRFGFKSHLT